MLAVPLKQAALVIAIAAIVVFTNLGGPRLFDRDEPRNAGCAREMLARGDWVVPWFNGELRAHKPVLLYWCIMVSYLGLGVSEFAARLPSALCAIGTVLCTYRLGRRLFAPPAGVWAGIALATSLMFVVAARAATPDSLLIFCTTLALTIYVCGTFRPRFETTPAGALPEPIVPGCYFPQHWPHVLVMYGVMGLGVLAKGPVGLIMPTAVIGMFLLIARLPGQAAEVHAWSTPRLLLRLLAPFEPVHFLTTCWSMRPLTAVFAAAAVALPWYWAVGLATEGEFLRAFFLEHNLGRAASIMENHSGSVLFYPLAILVGFFPWSIFAMPLVIDTILQLRRVRPPSNLRPLTTHHVPHATHLPFHAGHLLAVVWIGVYVVLFSLARTKLPSYVTPCYPALALLVGDYIDRWSRQSAAVAGRWLYAAFGCLALVGIAIAAGVPIAAKTLLPGEEWLGLIGLVPLAGSVACLGLVAVRSFRASAATLAMTATAFATLLFAVGAARVDRHQTNHLLWQAIYARSQRPIVASYNVLEPSWVFYGGTVIREFAGRTPAEQQQARSQAIALLLSGDNTFLITTSRGASDIIPHLPPQIGVLQSTRYFLHGNQELVVLGYAGASPGVASGRPVPTNTPDDWLKR